MVLDDIAEKKEPPKLVIYECQNKNYKGGACGHKWIPRTRKPEKCPKCGRRIEW